MIGPVNARVSVALPTLFRWRMGLAVVLVGWAAALMASAINGIRVEVE
jgi:hypothetical protein